jgi:23S rRNA pseudouridine2605 synthase
MRKPNKKNSGGNSGGRSGSGQGRSGARSGSARGGDSRGRSSQAPRSAFSKGSGGDDDRSNKGEERSNAGQDRNDRSKPRGGDRRNDRSDSRGEKSGRPDSRGGDRRNDRSDSRGEKSGRPDSRGGDRRNDRSDSRGEKSGRPDSRGEDRRNDRSDSRSSAPRGDRSEPRGENTGRPSYDRRGPSRPKKAINVRYNDTDEIRLNKYISNAGVCSRRDADVLIESGVVTVNGKVVTSMGTKVKKTDVVKYDNNTLSLEGLRYFVMNKPKDYITTMDDPKNRRTVMLLIKGACKERVYPIGRLDRDTTGLLLFTNDGDLSKALTHPSTNTKKIYHVHLDKQMTEEHLAQLIEGFELEDGFAKADEASFVGDSSRQVGIELHSGKNRIVRRMIAHLGYGVKKLDRVFFAGLTKKDVPRGKYRMLTDEEVMLLKRSVKSKS